MVRRKVWPGFVMRALEDVPDRLQATIGCRDDTLMILSGMSVPFAKSLDEESRCRPRRRAALSRLLLARPCPSLVGRGAGPHTPSPASTRRRCRHEDEGQIQMAAFEWMLEMTLDHRLQPCIAVLHAVLHAAGQHHLAALA